MRSGTGFQSVCHERCSSLGNEDRRQQLEATDVHKTSGEATHQTTAPRVKTILKFWIRKT